MFPSKDQPCEPTSHEDENGDIRVVENPKQARERFARRVAQHHRVCIGRPRRLCTGNRWGIQ